jgi:hypothetical protein
LRDGVIQIAYKVLCKNLGKIIEMLRKLIELKAKCLPLGHNMLKFRHDASNVPLKNMLETI